MNAASAIVLAVVLAFAAFAAWRCFRKGAPCSCGCGCKSCGERCKCHEEN